MMSTPQHNRQVATIFRSIAERLASQRANPYRVRAYRKAADTIEALEEDIADVAYEYPREIEFIEALPMTTTGKVQRKELRRREEEKLGER